MGAREHQHEDPLVETFAESMHELSEVWSSMMWLTTTSQEFNDTRRGIATWVRNTNHALEDTFGRGSASEEIRVIVETMPTLVPHRLSDDGRAFVDVATAEARQRTEEGRAAIEALTASWR